MNEAFFQLTLTTADHHNTVQLGDSRHDDKYLKKKIKWHIDVSFCSKFIIQILVLIVLQI